MALFNTTFQVNVKEALSVSITTPSEWASGTPTTTAATDLLRNKVSVDVISNNGVGFTATMNATTTDLVNNSKSTVTLPTLTESTTSGDFPANYWGYSLNTTGGTAENPTYNGKIYNETDEGNSNSYYHPIPTTLATILTGRGHATRDIYFGAKADISQASGTYSGTVVISVVTGEVNDNNGSDAPSTPTDPATPISSGDNPSYDSTAKRTVYTTTSGTTTTTQVSDGDNRNYYDPQGVTTSNYSSNVSDSSPLAIGLASAAAVAAVSGGIFFILAKRKKDDDEEEEQ